MKICFRLILILLLIQENVYATASGDSVNQAAALTQGANALGSQAAAQVGSNLAKQSGDQYSKCSGENQTACAMGALLAGLSLLSMLQSGAHGDSAGQAGTTALDTSAAGGTTPATLPVSASSAGFDSLPITKLAKGINGNSVDFKKGLVKTADGKVYPASDFSSPASMAASGFSPDQISSALAAAAGAEKQALEKIKLGALTPTNGIDDGGGGGGGNSIPSSSEPEAPIRQAYKAKPVDDAPVNTTPKNFNGDPIGSAEDSLFKMMARRYQFKDKQNAFINEHDLLYMKK